MTLLNSHLVGFRLFGVDHSMINNILHVRQSANNIKQQFRAIFRPHGDHGIIFLNIQDSDMWSWGLIFYSPNPFIIPICKKYLMQSSLSMHHTGVESIIFAVFKSLLPFKTLQSNSLIVESCCGSLIAQPVLSSVTWTTAAALELCVHISAVTTLQLRSARTAHTSDNKPGLSVPTSSIDVCSSEGSNPTEPLREDREPALFSSLCKHR